MLKNKRTKRARRTSVPAGFDVALFGHPPEGTTHARVMRVRNGKLKALRVPGSDGTASTELPLADVTSDRIRELAPPGATLKLQWVQDGPVRAIRGFSREFSFAPEASPGLAEPLAATAAVDPMSIFEAVQRQSEAAARQQEALYQRHSERETRHHALMLEQTREFNQLVRQQDRAFYERIEQVRAAEAKRAEEAMRRELAALRERVDRAQQERMRNPEPEELEEPEPASPWGALGSALATALAPHVPSLVEAGLALAAMKLNAASSTSAPSLPATPGAQANGAASTAQARSNPNPTPSEPQRKRK